MPSELRVFLISKECRHPEEPFRRGRNFGIKEMPVRGGNRISQFLVELQISEHKGVTIHREQGIATTSFAQAEIISYL
jgi:hypothetical protein